MSVRLSRQNGRKVGRSVCHTSLTRKKSYTFIPSLPSEHLLVIIIQIHREMCLLCICILQCSIIVLMQPILHTGFFRSHFLHFHQKCKLPYGPVCKLSVGRLVVWQVCQYHTLLKGREFPILCSYRSTCQSTAYEFNSKSDREDSSLHI